MKPSRRTVLQLGGAGFSMSLAGCIFAMPEEHVPVVLDNQHHTYHLLSVSLTSIPDESGFTTYFEETWELDAGETRTYEDDEGLTIGDHPPEVMALAVLEDETTTRSDFTVRSDRSEVRIRITAEGGLEVRQS